MHGSKGTARRSGANSTYKIAGKTGTAQVKGIKQDEKYDAEKTAEHLRDHGLFIGWAPFEDPQIVLAVVIENGGSGSASQPRFSLPRPRLIPRSNSPAPRGCTAPSVRQARSYRDTR